MKVISIGGDTRINNYVPSTGVGDFEAKLETASDGRSGIEPNFVGGNSGDPLVGGVVYPNRVDQLRVINRGTLGDYVIQQIMDTRDRVPKILLVSDDDGSNRRFVNVLIGKPRGGPKDYLFPLHVTGDVFWRAESETNNVLNVTANPFTITINSQAQADVFPRIVIRPLSNKTSSNPFKRLIDIVWECPRSATAYPVQFTLDTTGANFTGAAGEDLRVLANNEAADFWIEDPKTASTKIWVLLDFKPKIDLTLDGGLSVGDVDIIFNEAIDSLPTPGYLKIGSEVVYYKSKNDDLKRVSECTRGAEDTTATTHTDGTAVDWLQNKVDLTYGASSPTAYSPDNTIKPIFLLATSTNTSRVFNEFYSGDGKRAAGWLNTILQTAKAYSATAEGTADPASVIGVVSDTDSGIGSDISGYASIYIPTGITGANITAAKKFSDKPSRWTAVVRSSIDGQTYTDEYTIPAPTVATTEQSWTQNIASLTTGTLYLFMWLLGQIRVGSKHRVEIDTITLTLDSSQTPTVNVGGERGNYKQETTFTNVTSGIAFKITYDTQLNSDLEIDTAENTVTDLSDNSNQFQALDKLGGVRDQTFPLAPGDNEIKIESPGVASETITIFQRDRSVQ